jgi:hypothetical protein
MTTHRAVSPEEWTAARIGHVERAMEHREEYKDRRAAP